MNYEQMIGQMANAIVFPGFNDLIRWVPPIFLLMERFLCRFPAFSGKVTSDKKFDFFKMYHRFPFFSALHSSVRRFCEISNCL